MCNVVIDGGSSKNIVSKALVDVIGFPTKKYPSPHKIGWIKKRAKMRVNEICHVSFSIGKIYSVMWWI